VVVKKKVRKERAPKAAPVPKTLLYKVVELSNVDESSLEDVLNTWVSKGWTFDGVQFAMRESSKRPSMGFVFFTREGTAEDEQRARDQDDAHRNLRRLAEPLGAGESPTQPVVQVSAWERLAQLAEEDDGD
jgi:hypothetical protein